MCFLVQGRVTVTPRLLDLRWLGLPASLPRASRYQVLSPDIS